MRPPAENTAPQRGSRNGSDRGRNWAGGVVSAVGIGGISRNERLFRRGCGRSHRKTSRKAGDFMPEENKKKFALWIHPDTQSLVNKLYSGDNCKSRSEFIEKAVRFYCGYLSAQDALDILPRAITAAVSGAVQSSENRMARLMFKLAVEMSMMMNVVAAGADVDDTSLSRLRGKCVDDVKKSIGAVNFDDVLKFQRGG